MHLRETSPSFKAVIRVEGPKHNAKKLLPPLIDEINRINKRYPQPLLENSKASPERQELFKKLIIALKKYSISRFSDKNVTYVKLGEESCKLKNETTLRHRSNLVVNVNDPNYVMINGFRFKYEDVKPKQILVDAHTIDQITGKKPRKKN